MIKFSIIIPAYNAGKTLGRCLDSLKAQTYMDFEVIVVDDGSSDETVKVAERYLTSLDLKIINGPHSGVSSARNRGIDLSQGDWVTFLDADDALPNEALFEIDSTIRKYDIREILRASICTVTQDGRTRKSHSFCDLPTKYGRDDYPELVAAILGCNRRLHHLNNADMLGCSAAVYCERSFLNKGKIRYNCEISFMEDLIFMLSALSHASECLVSPVCSYCYYVEDSVTTKSFTDSHLHSLVKVNEEVRLLTADLPMKKGCTRFTWGLIFLCVSLSAKTGQSLDQLFSQPEFQTLLRQAEEASPRDMGWFTTGDWVKYAAVTLLGSKSGFLFR